MSEIVEVNGVEVEVTETHDGFEAEEVTNRFMKFTDDHNDSIFVPAEDSVVVQPNDEGERDDFVVGVYVGVSGTHKSAGRMFDDPDVDRGYYFSEMEVVEK